MMHANYCNEIVVWGESIRKLQKFLKRNLQGQGAFVTIIVAQISLPDNCGIVRSIRDFGAFIDIGHGVEGLVHVTEMSWTKRITKPGEVLSVGDEVDAVVLGIQKDDQKISLGLRQLDVNPWDMATHNYPPGARVRGKIRNLTSYGAFVELEEGIDGMVHVSDMSWTRKINHPSEMVKKGDEVDAEVVAEEVVTCVEHESALVLHD